MSRLILTAALLVLAATTQAMTPVRHGPNGAGSPTCPESTTANVVEEEAPSEEIVAAAATAAPAAPAVTPGAKAGGLTRPARNGARWHSFLPGMYK